MNSDEFERTARRYLRQEPFQPFVIALHDGRSIVIDQPSLTFGGGGATFLSPTYELVSFAYEEVREIREATHEMSS